LLGVIQNAWKVVGLRKRILFTMAMFVIYRLGAHIPMPGINAARMQDLMSQGGILGYLDLFSGGALARFSILALGITPYINSSIVMQLLTMVIPSWEHWRKEEEGRRKLKKYTRYGTVFFAGVQAVGMSVWLSRNNALEFNGIPQIIAVIITMTTGTIFLMWIGELISDKGIGNGISLLIFASIVSRGPAGVMGTIGLLRAGTVTVFNVLIFVVIATGVIYLIVKTNEAQRRIPVQYAKLQVGRKMFGGQTTFIPVKLNPAGVIPVIFASSILLFPTTVTQFFPASAVSVFLAQWMGPNTPLYMVLYALLIIFFVYFYTMVTFNANDVADNIKKNGGFVPGIRPGLHTAEYIQHILNRTLLWGALFLAAIAVMPDFVMSLTKISSFQFGGTSLLIVVGVALDMMKQMESQLLMRHYQGFLNK